MRWKGSRYKSIVMATKLSGPEIYMVVNDYIGVDAGYLCDFSYRSHKESYPYCRNLNIDPGTRVFRSVISDGA